MSTNYYCDISLISGGTYAATPTAAGTVPTKVEDGNGKASGAAGLASLVITFTGLPSDGEAITIAGVTFTAKSSGASGNQFNVVTDATTCATNLKNAINASSTNAVKPVGEIAATAPLKNIVNATSSAGVVTVYARQGSAAWNSVTETENLTNASITSQWSGGADGAWGYLFNPVAVAWPTSQAAGLYGAIVATYLGQPTAGDVLHIRTRTGGVDNKITIAASCGVSTRTIGTNTSYFEARFDNGVIWSDGSSNGVFTIEKTADSVSHYIQFNGFFYLHGQMQSGTSAKSGGTLNFKFYNSASVSAGWYMSLRPRSSQNSHHTIIEGVEFSDPVNGTCAINVANIDIWAAEQGDPTGPYRVVNCKFYCTRSVTGPLWWESAYPQSMDLVDCLFSYGGTTTITGALISYMPAWGNTIIRLIRPKFVGGGSGQHSMFVWPSALNAGVLSLHVEDPEDMGPFILSSPNGCICGRYTTGTVLVGNGWSGSGQYLSSPTKKREFIVDQMHRLMEWRDAGFPTTGVSLAPDGTPMSVRFSTTPSTQWPGAASYWRPIDALTQVVNNSFSDGDRTITVRILIDDHWGGSSYTAPTDMEWWIAGTYTKTDGTIGVFSTRGTGSALASDSTTWSSLTYAPFGGATRTYLRWKFPVTLTGVKGGTDITLKLYCAKQSSALSEWVLIDPEFGVA
jgi:hypothetical protein